MVRVAIPIVLVVAAVVLYDALTSNAGTELDSIEGTTPDIRPVGEADPVRQRASVRRDRPSLELAEPGPYRIADGSRRPEESQEQFEERLRIVADLERFFSSADLSEEQREWTLQLLGRAQDGYLRALAHLSERSSEHDLATLLRSGEIEPVLGQRTTEMRRWFDTYLRVHLSEGLSERQMNRFRMNWDSIHFFARSRPLERDE